MNRVFQYRMALGEFFFWGGNFIYKMALGIACDLLCDVLF